jgi:quercetin dioxygenase-like cupin family protein
MESQPLKDDRSVESPGTESPRDRIPGPVKVSADELRLPGSTTLRFEGERYGSGISYFHVRYRPGDSVALHRHPYTETWVVLGGAVRFTVGDGQYTADGGETVVAPAHTWHGFANIGDDTLTMLCVHASPRIIQEWKENPDDEDGDDT